MPQGSSLRPLLFSHFSCGTAAAAPSGEWWLSGGTRVVVVVIATRPAGLRHSVFGDALCVVGGDARRKHWDWPTSEKLTQNGDNGSSVVVVEAAFFPFLTHPTRPSLKVLAASVRVLQVCYVVLSSRFCFVSVQSVLLGCVCSALGLSAVRCQMVEKSICLRTRRRVLRAFRRDQSFRDVVR